MQKTWESIAKGVIYRLRTVRNSIAKCVVRMEDGIAGYDKTKSRWGKIIKC